MTTDILSKSKIFKSSRGELPRYKQTVQVLKNYIRESDIKPNSKLPPLRELIKSLNLSNTTVNRALEHLEREGIIERQHGRGLFVVDRIKTGELAIVVQPQLLSPTASPYYSLACNALSSMINVNCPLMDLRVHVGKPAESEAEFADTLDLANPEVITRLRGVFTFHPLFDQGRKLEEHGVPVVLMRKKACTPDEFMVAFDDSDSGRQYLRPLIQGNCKSIAVLGMASVDSSLSTHWHVPMLEAIRQHDLQTKPEWMPITPNVPHITAKTGYDQFMQLWKLPQKPDGIVVTDDVACRGVLQACLQLGVDLPNDVQLVSHSNKGVEFPYHKPLTRLEFDPQEQVKHALELIVGMLGNKTITEKHVLVPGKLISGNTTKS